MRGKLAISKSGHDKGNIYVILKEDSVNVYVADGRQKPVENPKKKNKKHIQIIENLSEEMIKLLKHDREFRNEEIKRAIKLYQKNACN